MEHTDVLIVGAGISGIGTAVHLQRECPGTGYLILEGRAAIGGTWDQFRFPGIRSDSDMYTLGYRFKPWRGRKAIVSGETIRNYVRETAREYGVDSRIRFRHRVLKASWSSGEARWTVEAERGDTGERITFSCRFLAMCSGYYSYRTGHDPHFEGRETFRGRVVHPQQWPDDLDWRGKRVVVIGSGATAVTLVPALAREAAQVVMLQRSPTYVMSCPDEDRLVNALRRVLPGRWADAVARWKFIAMQVGLYRQSRRRPAKLRSQILDKVRQELAGACEIDPHFTPRYDPWDQRVCWVPHGDLFAAIRAGRASVVTDGIERFTENGIELASGRRLEADIVVTATGLALVTPGEMEFVVDGAPVDFSATWTYKGRMFSGVPNLVHTMGYINASWTLRADLTAEFTCRLLNHMESTGARQVTPRLRVEDGDMVARQWIDAFSPGYMQRGLHMMPRQGDRAPWINPQDHLRDRALLRRGLLDDGALLFDAPAFPNAALASRTVTDSPPLLTT